MLSRDISLSTWLPLKDSNVAVVSTCSKKLPSLARSICLIAAICTYDTRPYPSRIIIGIAEIFAETT